MAIAYLCLGSNLGDRQRNLTRALSLLSREARLEQVSSIYETEPVGFKEQPLFLNLVCRATTPLSPSRLLRFAKTIEARMGRVAGPPNSARPIDIDILFYDNQIVKTRSLTIPHPRLAERAFVLIPLEEIAPDLVHPELNKSIAQLASEAPERIGVQKWSGGPDVPAIRGRTF